MRLDDKMKFYENNFRDDITTNDKRILFFCIYLSMDFIIQLYLDLNFCKLNGNSSLPGDYRVKIKDVSFYATFFISETSHRYSKL